MTVTVEPINSPLAAEGIRSLAIARIFRVIAKGNAAVAQAVESSGPLWTIQSKSHMAERYNSLDLSEEDKPPALKVHPPHIVVLSLGDRVCRSKKPSEFAGGGFGVLGGDLQVIKMGHNFGCSVPRPGPLWFKRKMVG